MRFLLPAVLYLAACAWAPETKEYPSGLKIVLVDQRELDEVCSHVSDSGHPIEHADACYSRGDDTIYALNNCDGARALTHELAHREGIADPAKEGFDW